MCRFAGDGDLTGGGGAFQWRLNYSCACDFGMIPLFLPTIYGPSHYRRIYGHSRNMFVDTFHSLVEVVTPESFNRWYKDRGGRKSIDWAAIWHGIIRNGGVFWCIHGGIIELRFGIEARC